LRSQGEPKKDRNPRMSKPTTGRGLGVGLHPTSDFDEVTSSTDISI